MACKLLASTFTVTCHPLARSHGGVRVRRGPPPPPGCANCTGAADAPGGHSDLECTAAAGRVYVREGTVTFTGVRTAPAVQVRGILDKEEVLRAKAAGYVDGCHVVVGTPDCLAEVLQQPNALEIVQHTKVRAAPAPAMARVPSPAAGRHRAPRRACRWSSCCRLRRVITANGCVGSGLWTLAGKEQLPGPQQARPKCLPQRRPRSRASGNEGRCLGYLDWRHRLQPFGSLSPAVVWVGGAPL